MTFSYHWLLEVPIVREIDQDCLISLSGAAVLHGAHGAGTPPRGDPAAVPRRDAGQVSVCMQSYLRNDHTRQGALAAQQPTLPAMHGRAVVPGGH
jgi:hypothetical protein